MSMSKGREGRDSSSTHCTRRHFIETTAAAGALPGFLAIPALDAAQSQSSIAMPTPSARALMALFGLKYPIFEAPHGGATSPELASAVSNAGAMGALALLRRADEAHDAVSKVWSSAKGPFF